MLAKEGCGRTARVVGMTNASHPTVTEGTQMYPVTGANCTPVCNEELRCASKLRRRRQ